MFPGRVPILLFHRTRFFLRLDRLVRVIAIFYGAVFHVLDPPEFLHHDVFDVIFLLAIGLHQNHTLLVLLLLIRHGHRGLGGKLPVRIIPGRLSECLRDLGEQMPACLERARSLFHFQIDFAEQNVAQRRFSGTHFSRVTPEPAIIGDKEGKKRFSRRDFLPE